MVLAQQAHRIGSLMCVTKDFPADSTYMSTFTSRLHVIYNVRATKLPSYHESLKVRPLTHFIITLTLQIHFLGNVHPNKPELLTKNSINNPSTEISAKFFISTAKKQTATNTRNARQFQGTNMAISSQ
jgi:hypothetical protein